MYRADWRAGTKKLTHSNSASYDSVVRQLFATVSFAFCRLGCTRLLNFRRKRHIFGIFIYILRSLVTFLRPRFECRSRKKSEPTFFSFIQLKNFNGSVFQSNEFHRMHKRIWRRLKEIYHLIQNALSLWPIRFNSQNRTHISVQLIAREAAITLSILFPTQSRWDRWANMCDSSFSKRIRMLCVYMWKWTYRDHQ